MDTAIVAGLFALLGSLLGAYFTGQRQRERIAADVANAITAVKTEHMAETTALYYLNHRGYTDRSFTLISKRLGGFENDELRKILVRAGAVRYLRQDGSEWWRLLSRVAEHAKRTASYAPETGEDDL